MEPAADSSSGTSTPTPPPAPPHPGATSTATPTSVTSTATPAGSTGAPPRIGGVPIPLPAGLPPTSSISVPSVTGIGASGLGLFQAGLGLGAMSPRPTVLPEKSRVQ